MVTALRAEGNTTESVLLGALARCYGRCDFRFIEQGEKNDDFDSAVSDVAAAAAANGIDADTIAAVGAILESLHPAVMGTKIPE